MYILYIPQRKLTWQWKIHHLNCVFCIDYGDFPFTCQFVGSGSLGVYPMALWSTTGSLEYHGSRCFCIIYTWGFIVSIALRSHTIKMFEDDVICAVASSWLEEHEIDILIALLNPMTCSISKFRYCTHIIIEQEFCIQILECLCVCLYNYIMYK